MMSAISKGVVVDSQLGESKLDSEGAPISGVRLDVSKAYTGVPALLQKVINANDAAAWTEIVTKIDYIYANLDHSLAGLDRETGFGADVQSQIRAGKKLLFKPNVVAPMVIDPETHGEGLGASICTDWTLVAALMRWFHDKLDITYHQMALGEASSSTPFFESLYTSLVGKTITSEALIEGRSEDFYAGWAFFFVRRYLSQRHPPSHKDDPMRGYDDSVVGRFIPPGRAADRLMVYDLNKLHDDPSKGIDVAVPDGANYKEITLHKAVVGGDARNTDDLRDYPGCVLVNVPKHKIHASDLITNAIKNLGIGLYPMQAISGNGNGDVRWKYSCPPTSIPCIKGQLPHMPWIVEMDDNTNLPVKDKNGEYIATKTVGMPGTQADVIRAVQSRHVFMVHVVDAIDMINISHEPEPTATRVPEGYVWSSLDCVALDLFCARYCFKTVPMTEGLKLKERNGWPTEFVHHVPAAKIEGTNIVSEEGLDSPLFRYDLYRYTEQRGVGRQKYYVVGWDNLTETPLASLAGHLGRIENMAFHELMTTTMYYNPICMLWDMQKTLLSYAEAHDRLTGSSLYKDFMDSFDENNDGVIDYDEKGRRGFWTPVYRIRTYCQCLGLTGKYGPFKQAFYETSNLFLKPTRKVWNPQGHDFAREYVLIWIATRAFDMSRSETVRADPFVQGMTWGKGMWPSWHLATFMFLAGHIYGSDEPSGVSLRSLFGTAFQYADKALNGGTYTGSTDSMSDPNSVTKYFRAVSAGADPLGFTLYLPVGYGSLNTVRIPNVEETEDPKKIFTAHFNGGLEVW
jgi:hypothetical protein